MIRLRPQSILICLLISIASCNSATGVLDIPEDYSALTKASDREGVLSYYDYSEKEGFWNQFTSLEGRISATQISKDDLSKYSSEELLLLCVTHPLTMIFPAYNYELQAVDVLAERLNVFSEFESREDAAEVLVDFYSRATVSGKQDVPCKRVGNGYSLSLLTCNFVELYISSARIPDVFVGDNAELLLSSAERLYDLKKSNPDIFSWFSFGKELFIVAELRNGEIRSYKDAVSLYFKCYATSSASTKAIGDFDFDFDSEFYIEHTALDTKCSIGKIPAIRYRRFTDDEIQSVSNEFRRYFPNATMPFDVKQTIDSRYNCHGYAWHMVDNNNPSGEYWINSGIFEGDTSILQLYWTNDYYNEIYSESNAEKIFYSFADHSAVKSPFLTGYYVSKWGYGPLVTHLPSDCPYPTTGLRYFAHGDVDPGDGPGVDPPIDDPDTPVTPPQPTILPIIITGSVDVRVGQSYTYQASQLIDTEYLVWSCSNPAAQISPSNGRTITFTANSAGRFSLVVEHNMFGDVLGRGQLIIFARE